MPSVTTTTLQDFPALLSRVWTWGKRAFWIALFALSAIIVLEAIHLHELLTRVHPWLAWSVTGLLIATLLFGTLRTLILYLRVPRVLTPPELPSLKVGWNPEQQETYRRFAVKYLERQARNPHLDDEAKARIPETIAEIQRHAEEWPDDQIEAAHKLVEQVEPAIGEVIASLDDTAGRMIRRTAVEVSVATAVSPSILLDSLITLNRNVNMITKLADLYYGRPGLIGSLHIVRDVIGAAVAAGALEAITDQVTSVAAEVTGSWSSRLLGPLGQGAVNGVVTMRLGAAARTRCRSLHSRRVPWTFWRMRDYRKAVRRLLDWMNEEVGPAFTSPIARWLGRSEQAQEGDEQALVPAPPPKEPWWKRVFRRKGRGGSVPAEVVDEGVDPLLDSDLLE